MNAAKKIRKLIESGAAEGDVAVLVDLARSLETGVPFHHESARGKRRRVGGSGPGGRAY